jgi:hypothetical protein
MSSVRRYQIVLISILSVVGCRYIDRGISGSGVAKTESRDVGNFEVIDFSGSGTLNLTVGPPAPLTITADDNLLPLIETSVCDGRLIIGSSQSISPKTALVVHASATDIKSVNISGAAATVVSGINNESFTINLSGSGSIKLAGKTDRLTLSISGAASADAINLEASAVAVDISGTGSAKVHPSKTLIANMSGSGSITYIGDPKVEQNISGIGSVQKIADPLQAEAEPTTR